MLEAFEDDYLRFKSGGFSSLRDECKALSLVLGKKVKIEQHHRLVEGIAVDIDEKGALIVRADDGVVHRIFSGDVVL
jgi:BirA family biotin operon repressor/biotin-[acetyl-CoA-carboxylase] ligase